MAECRPVEDKCWLSFPGVTGPISTMTAYGTRDRWYNTADEADGERKGRRNWGNIYFKIKVQLSTESAMS